jgi:predicted nucleotidyltransferase
MPFGAIADEVGDVYFSSRGQERISTVGYEAVLSGAAMMETPTGQHWPVVTLPGLVVLKLLAWQGRPERGKDALDIRLLLQRYFELEQSLIFDQHHDLFDADDETDSELFLVKVAARVLGRQIRQLVIEQSVRTRLLELLAQQEQLGEQSALARAMVKPAYTQEPAVPSLLTCLVMLRGVRMGMEDSPW